MSSARTPNQYGHDDADNTALRGAFLAFQKTTTNPKTNNPSTPTPKLTPTPTRDTGNGHGNSALMAATSASRDRSLAGSPSVSRQTTGDNRSPGRDHRQYPQYQHHSTTGQSNLLTPVKPATGDPRSPSLIAATIAASGSASPSPKITPVPQLNARQPGREYHNDSAASSVTNLDLTTDSSSIGPTNALVSLFERKEDETDPVKKRPALSSSKKVSRVALRPMTPPRTMSPVVTTKISPSRLASSFAWEKAATTPPSIGQDTVKVPISRRDVREPPENKRLGPPTPPPARIKVAAELPVLTPLPNSRRKPRPPTPPQAINQTNSLILSPQPRRTPSQISQDPIHISMATIPTTVSSIGGKSSGNLVRRSSSSLSDDTFVSASSAPSPQPDSPRKSSHRPTPPVQAISIVPPSRPSASQSASSLPLESLTSAIVAGSLASARASPSIAKPPTPPPRKQTPHMRQTLRAPRAKSEEEVTGVRSQHKKTPLDKLSSRKKHAHNEGARKRWREEITTRERQRYEGVWASNRSLLLDSPNAAANGLQDTDTSQLVANVVARDIWARSRLPFDELAEVWDLVDVQGRGALDRAQFVVGMWLIDQRLRGRKIPRKVSDSVWGSAKGVRLPSLKR
ncbi:hypothetical protein GQX73_g2955 [Xylaria multiplex]|uniref:EH domain-containing protein n=1 Tax=Xylaria multiplex TaxID=323545 RepID=A0A7C8J4M3_9PEZI|nr:hypothetical protein GQX73_g2955 [Xylaria multiplex]